MQRPGSGPSAQILPGSSALSFGGGSGKLRASDPTSSSAADRPARSAGALPAGSAASGQDAAAPTRGAEAGAILPGSRALSTGSSAAGTLRPASSSEAEAAPPPPARPLAPTPRAAPGRNAPRPRPDGAPRGAGPPLPDGDSFHAWLALARRTFARCEYQPPQIADRLLAAEMFAANARMESALRSLEEALVLLRAFLEAEGRPAELPDPLTLRVERYLLRGMRRSGWLDDVAARIAERLPVAGVEDAVRQALREELSSGPLAEQARVEVRRWGGLLRRQLQGELRRARAVLEQLAADSAERAVEPLRDELFAALEEESAKVARELRDDQRVLRIVKRYVLTRDAVKESREAQGDAAESGDETREIEPAEAPTDPTTQERLSRLEQTMQQLVQRLAAPRKSSGSAGSSSVRRKPRPGDSRGQVRRG